MRELREIKERAQIGTDFALLAATRVILGAGVGLLVAGALSRDARKGAGISLAVVGGLSTIPLAIRAVHHRRELERELERAA